MARFGQWNVNGPDTGKGRQGTWPTSCPHSGDPPYKNMAWVAATTSAWPPEQTRLERLEPSPWFGVKLRDQGTRSKATQLSPGQTRYITADQQKWES